LSWLKKLEQHFERPKLSDMDEALGALMDDDQAAKNFMKITYRILCRLVEK